MDVRKNGLVAGILAAAALLFGGACYFLLVYHPRLQRERLFASATERVALLKVHDAARVVLAPAHPAQAIWHRRTSVYYRQAL